MDYDFVLRFITIHFNNDIGLQINTLGLESELQESKEVDNDDYS